MSLTLEEEELLVALRAARLKIIKGEKPERVSYGGFDTQFAKADLGKIEGEIAMLESKASGKSGRKRGAMRFHY